MSGQDIDRAAPERRPDVFKRGHCAACQACHLDMRNNRCDCGGPFNQALEYDRRTFIWAGS